MHKKSINIPLELCIYKMIVENKPTGDSRSLFTSYKSFVDVPVGK